VIDFVPEPETDFGFAHMTVVTDATQPAAAARPAPGDAISEYLNPGSVKPWQYENLAAFITARMSGGREIRVQLWLYVTPKGSAFSVGGSTPVVASDPGRFDDEGFRLWVGTRPQGTTTVEISNLPDYQPARRQMVVPDSPDRRYEQAIEVTLQRKR